MAVFESGIATAVEITERYIKLAQIASKGAENKVIACVHRELADAEAKSASAALQAILRECNIKPKDLVLVIPRQSVTIKDMKLPSRNPAEIEEMAGFQAVKQIPYSKEEIAYGFNVIDMDEEGYSKVMLVICHRDVIDRPISILGSCGLSPSKVTLSSFGLVNWFNLSARLRKKSEDSPIILVDCDSGSSDVAVVRRGKLIYTRGLAFGSSEGGGYYGRLADEITRTLPIYERESEAPKPAELILTGNIPPRVGEKEELERLLSMRVDLVKPFEHIPLNVPPPFNSYVAAASFASLVGAAAGGEDVDLLPKVLRSALAARAKRRALTTAAVLASAVVLLSALTLWNRMHQRQAQLTTLEAGLKEIMPVAQQVDQMRLASQIIKDQLKKKSEALDVLNEIYRIIPSQLYLVLYTYDEEKVELKGTAGALSDVFRLVTVLEDSPYFQNVELRYATKRKVENQEFIDFEIGCPLSAAAGKAR